MPDHYEASVTMHGTRLAIVRPGRFRVTYTHVALDGLAVNAGWTESGQVVRGRLPARHVITFMVAPGPQQAWYGHTITADDLIVLPPAAGIMVNTPANCRWGTIGIDPDQLTRRAFAAFGRDVNLARTGFAVRRASPTAMQRLRFTHGEVARLATDEPETLANPNAVSDLSAALWESVLGCLGDGTLHQDRSATRRHAAIMARFEALLAAQPKEVLQIADVCTIVGVSEGTLHACCIAYTGLAPLRYMRVRRLNLARRELAAADSTATTVSAVATDHGFWELGRFAASYRQLFGELPSATLRQGCAR